MEMCGQLHFLAASDMRKEPLVSIEHETEGGTSSGLAPSEIRKICYPCREPNFHLLLLSCTMHKFL